MNDEEITYYYKKYGPMVLRRCTFILNSEDKALDAMQDVFVKMLSSKNNLTTQFPSALLYKIATNVCLNMIKKDKNCQVVMNDDLLSTIACNENIESRFLANEILDKIFMREPVSTREIAVMHYVDKMTLEETAMHSGLSVSGVRKRLRKLREKNLPLLSELTG